MTWLFSKRCEKLIQRNEIEIIFSDSTFNRILRLIGSYNEQCSNKWGNFSCLDEEAITDFIDEFGVSPFGIDIKYVSGLTYQDAIQNGLNNLFDIIEIYYGYLSQTDKQAFQQKFNEIMDENDLPWRMADGKIFPVDSKYIAEEILQRANELLHESYFQGALHEFNKAREEFTNKEYENAIYWANKAVESTIKSYFNIQKSISPGKLYDRLKSIDSIPSYLHKYIDVVSTIRNADSAHGQGMEVRQVPKNLAELALNMSASIIKYLVQLYIDQSIETKGNETIQHLSEEEIPF